MSRLAAGLLLMHHRPGGPATLLIDCTGPGGSLVTTLPKAHVRHGENPEATAKRALLEQAGLHAQRCRFLREETGNEPQGRPHQLMRIRWFIAIWDPPAPERMKGTSPAHSPFWCPAADWRELTWKSERRLMRFTTHAFGLPAFQMETPPRSAPVRGSGAVRGGAHGTGSEKDKLQRE